MTRIPVKTSVGERYLPQAVQAHKDALMTDPLLKLSEAVSMLGDPSYTVLRGWIKSGELRVWRAAGKGNYRVRLSEVERFIQSGFVEGSNAAL